MLRILVVVLIGLFPAMVYSAVEKYKEPDKASLEEQRELIRNEMKNIDQYEKSDSFSKVLSEERDKLGSVTRTAPGLNIQMPGFLEKERNDRYLSKALSAGNVIDEAGTGRGSVKYPIILVSLSMPENQVKELIFEADKIGAAVVVRGLIDDDFQKTILKLKQMAGDQEGGVMIDPTVFQRFKATAVPTFVLPLEELQQCTSAGCPTPKHVKASGSATLQYFLDLVSRTGDSKERIEAEAWLTKYEK